MKLNCGNVKYVIKQFILKMNQNIINPNLIKAKKNLVVLLKNMNLLDRTLIT